MEKYQQYRQHNSSDLCNKLLGALFMLFWLQEACSYRKGVYCGPYVRSSFKIESEWL